MTLEFSYKGVCLKHKLFHKIYVIYDKRLWYRCGHFDHILVLVYRLLITLDKKKEVLLILEEIVRDSW